jgi:2-dehydropantoate 2-reductase
MTKICIFGAGAIGGYIAASLKKTDAEISLIVRGPHKKAIEEKGLTFVKNGKSENFKFNVTDDPKKLGVQDYIFISVKAHSISNIVDTLSPMINEQTSIVTAVNGLPWWYFYKANTGTDLDNKHIESVDPNGKIWNTFKPERAIGCVVYPACEITEPGVIKHNEGERFSLGEPDGTKSERLKKIANLLIAGGLKVPQKKNLRDEIWIKLWGNCSFNPVSALTNTTLDQIGNDKELLKLVRKIMEECQLVGEKIGVKFNVSIDDRIKGATSVIGHKPSTTQDLNAGKPLEIDPIIGSIIEIGNKLKIEIPNLKTINSRLKLKAENMGLYQRSKLIEEITK